MRRLRTMAALAAVTMLSGCWLQPGYDAGMTRYNPLEDRITAANVATLHQIWSQPGLGRTAVAPSEPILAGDGGVYLVQAGTLFGIDGATGAIRWSRELHDDFPFVDPVGRAWSVAAVGDELWVGWGRRTEANPPTGTCTGQIERVDPADGSTLGTVSTDGPGQVVPMGGGRVAVNAWVSPRCSGSSWLRVYDTDAGAPTLAWASERPTSGNPTVPRVVGGEILDRTFFHDVDGCGAPTCWPTRYLELPNGFDTGVDGVETSISEGRIYVTGREHDGTSDQAPRLLVLDATSGELLWRAVGYRGAHVAVTPEWVFVAGTRTGEEGSPHSFLDAYPADGCGAAVCTPAWSASLGYGGMHHSLAVAGDVVYAGYRWYEGDPPYDDRLVAFDVDGCGAATCEPLADLEVPALVQHIVVAGGRVVVHADGLVAFAAE